MIPRPPITYDSISLKIGEERLFLHSGEIHHFRTQPEQWEDSLKKIRAANLNAISVYVPWNWHEVEEGKLDFTGRTHPRRNLVRFLETAHDQGLYIVLRPGPYICSEWLNGGIPPWLLERHPAILALSSTGRPAAEYGMIYPPITYCHPTYLEYVRRWYHAVLSVTRPFFYQNGGNIINLQLDDEQSYWRTLEQGPLLADYNPLVIGDDAHENRYGSWLQQKYRDDLAQVNRLHRGGYAHFKEVKPPYAPLDTFHDLPAYLDWYWFKFSEIDEYIKNLYWMMREEGVNETISTLDHYLFAPLAFSKFTRFLADEHLDILLTGQYYSAPLFELSDMREDKLGSIAANLEIYKSSLRHVCTPPILMEIQSAMNVHLTAPEMEELYRLVLAQGIKGLNYYIMAGGENHPDFVLSNGRSYDISAPIGYQGDLRPHYFEIQDLGRQIFTFEQDLLESEPLQDLTIGFYEPYEACMYQGNLLDAGFRDDYQHLMHEYFNYFICRPRGMDFFTLLTHSGVNFGMENLEDVSPEKLASMKSLWVLGLDFMASAVQQKLADYVRLGGALLMFPRIPMLDENMQPCTILADIYGAQPLDPQPSRRPGQPPWFRSIDFADRQGILMFDTVDLFNPPADANVIAVEHRSQQPCAFGVAHGKGKAVLLGFKLRYVWDAHGDHKAFIRLLLDACDVRRACWSESGEIVVKQLLGQGTSFLTAVNPANLPQTTRIFYRNPRTNKEHQLPQTADGLTFTRQGGVIFPLNLALPRLGVQVLYCLAEILEYRDGEETASLLLRNSGIRGMEIALESAKDVRVNLDGRELDGKRLPGGQAACFPIDFDQATGSLEISVA